MPVSRRHFFLGTFALSAWAAKKPAPVRPHVVLILVDDLPDWVLGIYGNREVLTPNLDRLAQMGTRFTNHSVCSPAAGLSRATMLTGRTPMQLGDAANAATGPGSLEQVMGGLGYTVKHAVLGEAPAALDPLVAGGKPFLLVASHASLKPPYAGVDKKFQDLYAGSRFETFNAQPVAAANARAGKELLADVVANLRKYAAAVSALDTEVGTVVARLSERRALEQTLIVLASSAGAMLGRRGLWGAGDAADPPVMYDEAIATPLFWVWSGRVPAQGVRPELVSTYDLLPTICDVLDAPAPAGNLCGRSYELLVTGKPLPKKEPWRTTVFGHYGGSDMARIDRYKLVVHEKGAGELYDRRQDPVERVNQYDNPQFLTVRNGLSESLAGWKRQYSR